MPRTENRRKETMKTTKNVLLAPLAFGAPAWLLPLGMQPQEATLPLLCATVAIQAMAMAMAAIGRPDPEQPPSQRAGE